MCLFLGGGAEQQADAQLQLTTTLRELPKYNSIQFNVILMLMFLKFDNN